MIRAIGLTVSSLFVLTIATMSCDGEKTTTTTTDGGGGTTTTTSGGGTTTSSTSTSSTSTMDVCGDGTCGPTENSVNCESDCGPVVCYAETSYGDATLTNQASSADAANGYIAIAGDLDANTPPDLLYVELYEGFGIFANGIGPGTYTIAGAELNYSSCGLCVRILTEVDPSTGPNDDGYLATGGSVIIDTVDLNTNEIAGSASGLTFEHVTIDGGTFQSTPHPDAGQCVSAITTVSFSTAMGTGGGGGAGGGGGN